MALRRPGSGILRLAKRIDKSLQFHEKRVFGTQDTVGFLKGKSAVRIHREVLQERRMIGLKFWATGYWVSTVGLDEQRVRKYIREQEQLGAQQGDLDLK